MPVQPNCLRQWESHEPHYFDSHRWCNGKAFEKEPEGEQVPTIYRMCEKCRVLVPLPGMTYSATVDTEATETGLEIIITLHTHAEAVISFHGSDIHTIFYPRHVRGLEASDEQQAAKHTSKRKRCYYCKHSESLHTEKGCGSKIGCDCVRYVP